MTNLLVTRPCTSEPVRSMEVVGWSQLSLPAGVFSPTSLGQHGLFFCFVAACFLYIRNNQLGILHSFLMLTGDSVLIQQWVHNTAYLYIFRMAIANNYVSHEIFPLLSTLISTLVGTNWTGQVVIVRIICTKYLWTVQAFISEENEESKPLSIWNLFSWKKMPFDYKLANLK